VTTGGQTLRGVIDGRGRERALEGLASERFDCVVVGGGMTGAGIAWQGARRGLRIALVEAADFAEGTSSRSTKLIHGGLRYLAQGDIGLVRHTALERKVVHRLAPHLASPRWLVVPARSRFEMWKLRLGIGLYERLGQVPKRDRHRCWNAADFAREEPSFVPAPPFGCVYREYATNDARLVTSVLREGVANGAVVAQRLPVIAFPRDGSRVRGVRVRCAEEGREFEIRGRCVINAAGPWVDAVAALENRGAPARLHLTKGIHLGISRARLPLRNMALLPAADGRRIFAIPSGGVTYIGTTDTTYEADAELWPEITPDDVRYLLGVLDANLPGAGVGVPDIVTSWSGLRPLIAEPGKGPSEISRKDEVWLGEGGVVHIAGGKLTGFRPMALRALKAALGELGEALPDAEEETPLPGGELNGDGSALMARLVDAHGIEDYAARRLVGLYGGEAEAVARLGSQRIAEQLPLLRGEVS
jgi:glycerol-3-phosphate dehydrogenase